jgi:hypothetical protein
MSRRTRWAQAAREVATAAGLLGLVLAAAVPEAIAQSFDLAGQFTAVRGSLFSGLANQVGTLPSPTGGGFAFTLDPALGVFTRTTDSFGPVFASRYETTGQGKFTLNASYSRHTFDEVDGVNLRDGQLNTVLASLNPAFPGLVLLDLVSIQEEVSADVGTLGFLYGATDRIDVGLTIPILKVKVKERVTEQALLVCPTVSVAGCFDPGFIPSAFRPNEADQTGLGDIVLRGKYNFLQVPQLMGGRLGMAFSLDVKLPTGDKGDRKKFLDPTAGVDLLQEPSTQQFQLGDPPLGTGIVRVKPLLITSGSWFGFNPHINVGAELGTTQGITNDLVYEVGADYTFFGRATLSADLLGRHAFDVDRTRLTKQITDSKFGTKANPDTLTASIGLKVNPFGTFLIFANVLLPLNETGIRDDITPTFGVEWTY